MIGQELIDSSSVHLEVVVYFDSDESVLSDDDKSDILALLQASKDYSDYKFWVDAHTDEVGNEDYNLALSNKRKESVVDYLLAQGVPPNFIESNHHGESKRVALEEDHQSRQLNRRAVLQLITKKQYLYLKGTILDEESKEGIPAQIQITAKDFKKEVTTDSIGRFKILSPIDTKILIEVVAKDYFIETKKLEIGEKHLDIKLKIPLPRVELGKKFHFQNMLFVGNKSIMLPSSHNVLNHLKRFMFVNNEYCIEIAGHVNLPNEAKVDRDNRYYRLSVARALEVHDAINKIGVDSKRLLARGYGNWEMVYPYARLESHMKYNRRVEIIISDCDSTAMIQNHSIPDRNEFMDIIDPHDRFYSAIDFKNDIASFPEKAQKDLTKQIKDMKENQLDPSVYTYRELLLALPSWPRSK